MIRILTVFLFISLFHSSAIAETLSERFVSNKVEPQCLNCCFAENTQDECKTHIEEEYRFYFYAHRIPVLLINLLFIYMIPELIHDQVTENKLYAMPLFFFTVGGFMRSAFIQGTQIYNSIQKWNREEKYLAKGIVLLLRSKNDWNFAMSSPNVAQLSANNIVLIQDIDYLSEISDSIESVKNRFKLPIKALILNAHGGEGKVMVFGKENLEFAKIHYMKNHLKNLDKDTDIILLSCTAGHEEPYTMGSLVQAIASIAEGRRVYGSSDFATPMLELDEETLIPKTYNSLVQQLMPGSLFFDYEDYFSFKKCYWIDESESILPCTEGAY